MFKPQWGEVALGWKNELRQRSEAYTKRHSRFALVFDREGYSPQFFKEMWDLRIACYTYNKFVKDCWPEEEFSDCRVCFVDGQSVVMRLAERGVFVGGKIWMREIRKLTKNGHQTSLLTTAYNAEIGKAAVALFARWSQENFFKYMREQFRIDRLIEYDTAAIPDTSEVINPRYRKIESQIKSKAALLYRRRALLGTMVMEETPTQEKDVQRYELKKALVQEELVGLSKDLCALKDNRKEIPKYITISQDARSLLQKIFTTEADIVPDEKEGTLTVALHNLATDSADKAAHELCKVHER